MNLSVQRPGPEALGYCFILLVTYKQLSQRSALTCWQCDHLSEHGAMSAADDDRSIWFCSGANWLSAHPQCRAIHLFPNCT